MHNFGLTDNSMISLPRADRNDRRHINLFLQRRMNSNHDCRRKSDCVRRPFDTNVMSQYFWVKRTLSRRNGRSTGQSDANARLHFCHVGPAR